jgi:hypothetical protein
VTRARRRLLAVLAVLGVVREARLSVAVTLGGGELRATARHVLKQKDHGIDPVSVAGLVKVKNELAITCTVVARAESRN